MARIWHTSADLPEPWNHVFQEIDDPVTGKYCKTEYIVDGEQAFLDEYCVRWAYTNDLLVLANRAELLQSKVDEALAFIESMGLVPTAKGVMMRGVSIDQHYSFMRQMELSDK